MGPGRVIERLASRRVVVAPDKFKGSLGAPEVARAIAAGLHQGDPGCETVLVPVADGGDGTVDAAVAAGYERRTVAVRGPDGERLVEAAFALRERDGVLEAVVEMAEASGLQLLAPDALLPMTATTRGTGEVLAAALDAGARRIVLGVGGSATNDGGAGMVAALGVRLLDATGQDLPGGGAALADLDRIDVADLDPRLAGVEVVLAGDVDNPLVGPQGAAAVYGPQKGADTAQVDELDAALARWAAVLHRDVGAEVAHAPGAGAAGGTGAAAMAFLGAGLRPGIDLVLEVVGFADALAGADLVVVGEGSLDAQSLTGKAPVGVARAAGGAGVPVVAVVGRCDVDADDLAAVGIGRVYDLLSRAGDAETAQREAARLLTEVGAELARD